MLRTLIFASFLGILMAGSAAAQDYNTPSAKAEPWKDAKLKIGPLFVAPDFGIRNVGIDDNVFHDEFAPRRDLTATVAVSSIFGFHARAFSLSLTQDNSYLWFR